MSLSDKLYEYRKLKGWSQEELADKLDVSRQTVSKWELGKAIPELDKLIKISDFYDVTIDELVKENNPIESEVEIKNNEKIKPKKVRKKFKRYIVLIFIILLLVMFICSKIKIKYRETIADEMMQLYRNNYSEIGITKSGFIREQIVNITKGNNVEGSFRDYYYYFSDNGEKLLRMNIYEDDECRGLPSSYVYVDLSKESTEMNTYNGVVEINPVDWTYRIINDYYLESPVEKVSGGIGGRYSLFSRNDIYYEEGIKKLASSDSEILTKFKSNNKNHSYGWTNNDLEYWLSLNSNNLHFESTKYIKSYVYVDKETIFTQISNRYIVKEEAECPPLEEYTFIENN